MKLGEKLQRDTGSRKDHTRTLILQTYHTQVFRWKRLVCVYPGKKVQGLPSGVSRYQLYSNTVSTTTGRGMTFLGNRGLGKAAAQG